MQMKMGGALSGRMQASKQATTRVHRAPSTVVPRALNKSQMEGNGGEDRGVSGVPW